MDEGGFIEIPVFCDQFGSRVTLLFPDWGSVMSLFPGSGNPGMAHFMSPWGPFGATQMDSGEIILAVDEPIHATRCTPGQPFGCRANKSRCLTHDLWEELGNQIYLYLSSVTLADIVARRVLGTSGLFKQDDKESVAAAQ